MPAVDVNSLTPGDVIKSGNIVHDRAGRLQVNFQGRWAVNGGDIDSAGSILLRCFLGSGASRQTALLGPSTFTAQLEADYAGGYVAVPFGFEYVAHSVSGPVTMTWSRLVGTWTLLGGLT